MPLKEVRDLFAQLNEAVGVDLGIGTHCSSSRRHPARWPPMASASQRFPGVGTDRELRPVHIADTVSVGLKLCGRKSWETSLTSPGTTLADLHALPSLGP